MNNNNNNNNKEQKGYHCINKFLLIHGIQLNNLCVYEKERKKERERERISVSEITN